MKRFSFLAALFGFGAAAKAQVPQSSEMVSGMGTAWDTRKPKNNQCPVCGTMAKAYHKSAAGRCCGNTTICFPEDPPCTDIVRCARCNCIFGRDAE